jgi:hypothetical protein
MSEKVQRKGWYMQTKFGYTLLSKIVGKGGVLNCPKDLDKNDDKEGKCLKK